VVRCRMWVVSAATTSQHPGVQQTVYQLIVKWSNKVRFGPYGRLFLVSKFLYTPEIPLTGGGFLPGVNRFPRCRVGIPGGGSEGHPPGAK
jgi:hypothetical protein